VTDPKLSKFLSLVLRHQPEKIGIQLDAAGWVAVDELLATCRRNGVTLTREQLDALVATSDKRRFAFDETGTKIRANQGHSVPVELGYEPAVPPETLYHGTVEKFLPSIRSGGLTKRGRHHVHLSADQAMASKVGERRGAPIVLPVNAGAMHRRGHVFMQSDNGVWLVDHVPPEFIQ
jgi:putative RNA 2'-phosphotransferase